MVEINKLTERTPVKTGYNPLTDLSLVSLLVANLISIYFVYAEGWTLFQVMWVYWFQSVTIGFFSFLRILTLRKFSTKGLKFSGRSVPPTRATQKKIASFFMVHFGGFHAVYLIFLIVLGGDIFDLNPIYLAITLIGFFIGHVISHAVNSKNEREKVPNLGHIMALPYARVVPMHIAMLAGGITYNPAAIHLFLGLKTVADLTMHIFEHKTWSNAPESEVKLS